MIQKILIVMTMFMATYAFGSQHQKIDTLGTSPAGQFVALEEYGLKNGGSNFYVTIKIMNVWKKEYVGSTVEVEMPAEGPDHLEKAREKAKGLASDQLREFKIRNT